MVQVLERGWLLPVPARRRPLGLGGNGGVCWAVCAIIFEENVVKNVAEIVLTLVRGAKHVFLQILKDGQP